MIHGLSYFSPQPDKTDIPHVFPSPFINTPHPLAIRAATELMGRLTTQRVFEHDFTAPDGGKMFGVLIVSDQDERVGFLTAFSGMLASAWIQPDFIPPIFDIETQHSFLSSGEQKIATLTEQLDDIKNSDQYKKLLAQREELHKQKQAFLDTLKARHSERKGERSERRKKLEQDSTAFKQMSFESQHDKREWKKCRADWDAQISVVENRINQMTGELRQLKRRRAALSRQLHEQVFAGYRLKSISGETKRLSDLFPDALPPGGSGDCAAPKLLQFANRNNLKPLALAEFWWGESPADTVRHQGHFYSACRGKCQPILPFMLQGIMTEPLPMQCVTTEEDDLQIAYEDEYLVVVNKPAGLLSIPGKETTVSAQEKLKARYPNATGPLLVHRLDMDTSGLLLAAKTSAVHKQLQRQFLERTIKKRYVALLDGLLPDLPASGGIKLPLRVDLNDRPHQLVCYEYGKEAETYWEVIGTEADGCTRIAFYPKTGRTHQLRVHASHRDGLNIPIRGDVLYGQPANRLHLHAENLTFIHPVTGEKLSVNAECPF